MMVAQRASQREFAGQSFPRLLLIKPDGTCHELLDGLCGQGETFRAEMIAEEIETSLDPPDEGFVGVANFSYWRQAEVPKCAELRPVLALKPTAAGRR